jgi:tripartite-type tricarboxylate transporter receptor subunit TctC
LRSVRDVLAAARAQPGRVSYASNGSGSLPHLTTEWFASQAHISLAHIPYKGSAQALPDLVAGRTAMMIDIIVSALPLIEGGRLRALAVTGAQPTTRLPGVPTVASSGFPGFASDQWYGLFAPAATPAAILQKIDDDVREVTQSPSLRGQMWQRGAEIQYSGSRAFSQAVKSDWQRWQQVAKATNARVE